MEDILMNLVIQEDLGKDQHHHIAIKEARDLDLIMVMEDRDPEILTETLVVRDQDLQILLVRDLGIIIGATAVRDRDLQTLLILPVCQVEPQATMG
jgi:hypothetical protein